MPAAEQPPAYDAAAIEVRRQQAWQAGRYFTAPPADAGRRSAYIKANSPFTSGSIHIGHVRSYSIADAYARFCRARGDAVLFTLGFDAFGLPAEQAAARNGQPPQLWVQRCRAQMTEQLKRLGFSFDWDRTFATCEEDFYRWSQWLFLRLLAADLIHRETANVDWCATCETTLATMQVEQGRCWRCGEPTGIVQQPQWYLRFNAYVEENECALASLGGWNTAAVAAQRGLLGRTEGVELDVAAPDGRALTVFTPYPDRVLGACFVMLSPRHPDVERWLDDERARSQIAEIRSVGWQRKARAAASVPILDTGCVVRLAQLSSDLPVLVSPAVDGRFGATAILGVPCADQTDATIAERLAMAAPAGTRRARHPAARKAVRYRTHDFSIARQRSWGTPVPVVHCAHCGIVPRHSDELPVLLAPSVRATGPYAAREVPSEPAAAACPRCGRAARCDAETLDAHFDGLWIWVPHCVPRDARKTAMFDHPELQRWLPGAHHVYGADCSTYTFDQRITAKALRDLAALPHLQAGEPFEGATMHGMVTLAGRKMSKHLGNVVSPDELVSRYGADVVRLAMLYAARPTQALDFSEAPFERCRQFVGELWAYAHPRLQAREPPAGSETTRGSARRRRLYWSCATAARRTTEHIERSEAHKAVRSVMRLLASIRAFEARVSTRESLGRADRAAIAEALTLLVQLLAPFAPHVGEELWLVSGADASEGHIGWPDLDAWAKRAGAVPVRSVG